MQLQELHYQKIFSLSASRVTRLRLIILFLPWFGFLCQCFIAQSTEDVLCSFLAAISSFIVFYDSFRLRRLYFFPISTLIILGFGITLHLGPLLFTLIESHNITYNLDVPVSTFLHGFLASLAVILAHMLYRNSIFLESLKKKLQRILIRFKFFRPINTFEVIFIGLIGLLAVGVKGWLTGLVESSVILAKFLQGFSFFSIIPFVFVLQKLTNPNSISEISGKRSRALWILIIFIALIGIVALGRNSRGVFIAPFACLLIGLVYEWLYGIRDITFKAFFGFLISIILVLPLITDFATAMVMVRNQRSNTSAIELAALTFDQMLDREAIKDYRDVMFTLLSDRDYNEAYISNIFLARFSNAKFPDRSLSISNSLSEEDREEMLSFHGRRFVSILPKPVLSLVGVPLSVKVEANRMSFGDAMYYLATRKAITIGNFKTGHIFGTGMAAFGFGYLLILMLGMCFIFPVVDSHVMVQAGSRNIPLFTLFIATQFITLLTQTNIESVNSFVHFFRFSFQSMLLYALALKITNVLQVR